MRTLVSKPLIWLLLIVIVLWSVDPLSALALGVTPSELSFRASPGGQCTRTLHIINDEEHELSCRIYVDEEHESWFSISPEEISIPPQQSSEIAITATLPLTAIGRQTAFIYITTVQPSSGLQVAPGIKIKATISVDVLSFALPILIVLGAVVIVLVVFRFLVLPEIRRGQKEQRETP